MARKLAAQAAPAPKDGPDPDILKKHFRDIAKAQGDVKKATGELGPLVKKAEEEGWHKAAGMLALKIEKMDAAKRSDFWRALTSYVGPKVLNLFSQTDLFNSERQAAANATTAPDTDDSDKRNVIAEEQGYQAGLAAHDLTSCTFPDNDPAKPWWQKGWRRGQNEHAVKITAPPAASTPKAAAPDDGDLPAFLDRRTEAQKAADKPKRGRPPKAAIPPVGTSDSGNAFH